MLNQYQRIIGLCVIVTLFVGCATTTSGGGAITTTYSLQEVIDDSALFLREAFTIQEIKRVAVVNFDSASERFSDYLVEELIISLRGRGDIPFQVVSRNEMDTKLRESEIKYSLSGEVSEDSAIRIGESLGAQVLITGELIDMGKTYRFRLKALETETGTLIATYGFNLNPKEYTIRFLLKNAKPKSLPEISEQPKPLHGRYTSHLNLGLTWDDSGIEFRTELWDINWSFLPYTLVGVGIVDMALTPDGGGVNFINPQLGGFIPITSWLTLAGYGVLDFGAGNLHGLIANKDALFITPAVKASLLVDLGGAGIAITYKGRWYAEGKMVNSIAVGIALGDIWDAKPSLL
jgi:TolB-like protein